MVGSITYLSTTSFFYEGCYAFNYVSPYSGYSSKSEYIGDYFGTPAGYDIGFQQTDSVEDIWMATDNVTNPVSCYQAGTGNIVCSVEACIGIGSDILGVPRNLHRPESVFQCSECGSDRI